uniref:Uncharacterized protein n=1 Tax=Chromera velia CCMP2878 TaxID=1169474 RepID=A0A0G4IBX2_9ALVE|eukprot:Cvel_12934.t1-p1 / transcript=Cvel_12934.t1 / gene=Cvel_12934 / organism=Chromera_velia_CCMP2878 / gene_product=hypothetical protein / transcript_product=hypothetical protein / location=Cvel_scaffold865:26309-31920(+) / protein_length=825 / sequence_SO=supercontig / SO=protein_coding / is_pseudo=false
MPNDPKPLWRWLQSFADCAKRGEKLEGRGCNPRAKTLPHLLYQKVKKCPKFSHGQPSVLGEIPCSYHFHGLEGGRLAIERFEQDQSLTEVHKRELRVHVIACNRQVVLAPLLPNPPPATAAAQQEDQQEEKDNIPPSLCDSASEVSSDEDGDDVERRRKGGKKERAKHEKKGRRKRNRDPSPAAAAAAAAAAHKKENGMPGLWDSEDEASSDSEDEASSDEDEVEIVVVQEERINTLVSTEALADLQQTAAATGVPVTELARRWDHQRKREFLSKSVEYSLDVQAYKKSLPCLMSQNQNREFPSFRSEEDPLGYGCTKINSGTLRKLFLADFAERERYTLALLSKNCGQYLCCDHTFIPEAKKTAGTSCVWTLINEDKMIVLTICVENTSAEELEAAFRHLRERWKREGAKPVRVVWVDRDCCSGKIRELFSILAANGEEVEVKLDLFHFINRMLKAAKQGHPYFVLYAKELQKACSILRASDLDKLIEVECSGEGGARNRDEAWKCLTPQLIAEVVRSHIPPAAFLERRLRRVWDYFVQLKTPGGELLFQQEAAAIWAEEMKHVGAGCLSDPEEYPVATSKRSKTYRGVEFPVWEYNRSTSCLEGWHRPLKAGTVRSSRVGERMLQAGMVDGAVNWYRSCAVSRGLPFPDLYGLRFASLANAVHINTFGVPVEPLFAQVISKADMEREKIENEKKFWAVEYLYTRSQEIVDKAKEELNESEEVLRAVERLSRRIALYQSGEENSQSEEETKEIVEIAQGDGSQPEDDIAEPENGDALYLSAVDIVAETWEDEMADIESSSALLNPSDVPEIPRLSINRGRTRLL